MPSYTATVPSSWTQEQTFAFLADFSNVASWDPSIDRATVTSGTGGELGATYDVVQSPVGHEVHLPYECVELRAPERVVFRCDTDALVSVDTITVEGDGTVTYDAQIELKGLRKLAEPLAQLGFSRAGDKARDGLEQTLAG